MEDVAPALGRRPVLNEFSAFYLQGFSDLSAMRSIGFNGVERLKLTEIQAYCAMFEVDDVERFFYNMRAADEVYMEWVAKAKK